MSSSIPISLDDFLKLSKKHTLPFPIQTARLEHLIKVGTIDEASAESFVNSAYPIIHENLVPLLQVFLDYKKNYSIHKKERQYYKDKTINNLVDKLIEDRPVAFLTSEDSFCLPNGVRGSGGFEQIGKSFDVCSNVSISELLSLSEYNGYDEMRLAALIAVSSTSPFINNGGRHNLGQPAKSSSSHQPQGVIVGQVGARFEKEGFMEWEDCAITDKQNTKVNGYGSLDVSSKKTNPRARLLQAWANVWGHDILPTFDDVKLPDDDYEPLISVKCDWLLNRTTYKARIRMMADVLLIEAASRANDVDKSAYVHIVGLGLGVWQMTNGQSSLYVDAWMDALRSLPQCTTSKLHTLNFSWIKHKSIDGLSSENKCHKTGVNVVFSKRNLHDPVPEECFLICNYAWDSNSAPGNEYWLGMLSASGDPAAACSSSIAELHNFRVNRRISAAHLMVACRASGQLVPFKDYLLLLQEKLGNKVTDESRSVGSFQGLNCCGKSWK